MFNERIPIWLFAITPIIFILILFFGVALYGKYTLKKLEGYLIMDGNKIIDNITLYQDYHGYYPASLDSLNLDNEMINCENFEYRLSCDSLYVISFELWPLYRFEYRPQEDEWLKLYLQ